MAGFSESVNPPPRFAQQGGGGAVREDCWSEEATATLVEAWGRRYVELNRGNLRQKDWQEVADAVNSRHSNPKKSPRTDVQCKNRIDTLKKKYKVEKTRVSDSDASFTSPWPFFSRLDSLIGSLPSNKKFSSSSSPSLPPAPPFRRCALPPKRASPSAPFHDSYFRRNYSATAAAAAAGGDSDGAEEEEEGEEEDNSGDVSRSGGDFGQKEGGVEGVRRLARAISRFGEIYERVEGEKQRQMVELERQRMQFARDLEFQRMQIFMNTQLQLQKFKRSKRCNGDDMYN